MMTHSAAQAGNKQKLTKGNCEESAISFCWKAYQEGGRYELFQYRGTLSVVPEGSEK
jgi:hypothetical protein